MQGVSTQRLFVAVGQASPVSALRLRRTSLLFSSYAVLQRHEFIVRFLRSSSSTPPAKRTVLALGGSRGRATDFAACNFHDVAMRQSGRCRRITVKFGHCLQREYLICMLVHHGSRGLAEVRSEAELVVCIIGTGVDT